MKRYLFLAIALFLLRGQVNAQFFAISSVYTVTNDTMPANSTDSLEVWVKNISAFSWTANVSAAQAVQDSAASTFHFIDSVTTFVPVTLAPGDSIPLLFNQFYDIDTLRYHYDINVIVIWPMVSGYGGDSLTFVQVITGTTGLQELDLEELIQAFPNPVKNDLHLKNDGKSIIEEVRIYDSRGRLVDRLPDIRCISTENWEKGCYLLQMTTTDKRTRTIRIIKQ